MPTPEHIHKSANHTCMATKEMDPSTLHQPGAPNAPRPRIQEDSIGAANSNRSGTLIVGLSIGLVTSCIIQSRDDHAHGHHWNPQREAAWKLLSPQPCGSEMPGWIRLDQIGWRLPSHSFYTNVGCALSPNVSGISMHCTSPSRRNFRFQGISRPCIKESIWDTSACQEPENVQGTSLSRKCGGWIIISLPVVSIYIYAGEHFFFEDWWLRSKGIACCARCAWRTPAPKTEKNKQPSDERNCGKQAVLLRMAKSKLKWKPLGRQPWIWMDLHLFLALEKRSIRKNVGHWLFVNFFIVCPECKKQTM